VFIPVLDHRSKTKHERILLLSHAATIIALSRELLGDENREMGIRVGCCSLTEFVRKKTKGAVLGKESWEVLKLADGGHLTGGASRDWGFEDIEIANGKVVADPGDPGTEDDVDEPVGCQIEAQEQVLSSNL